VKKKREYRQGYKKNGKTLFQMQKILLIYAFLLPFTMALQAEEINFIASAPPNVVVGERFRVAFQVNARPSEFNAPTFSGFSILSGPNQSSSSSVQIINGRTTQAMSITYSYIIEATAEGTFTIPSARVTVDGKSYSSNPVTINVGAGSHQRPAQQHQQPQQQQQQPQDRASSQDIFIRATTTNSNPFQGEQVIVVYNLYTRVSVQQYSTEKLPSYQGFWSENITGSGQPQIRTEVVNGETYRVAEIRRVALFPQRSGELTIEPLEVDAVINLPGQRSGRNLFDDFFGGSPFDQRRTIKQTIKSNPITLKVRPLPSQNRPASFRGMVGSNFEVKADLNATEMRVNDAANLRITINGNGNLRMLEKPGVHFPANLEVFDPNVSDNIRNTSAGISGSRTYEYIMIPRTPGEFIIPPYHFSWFDPVRETYVTRQTPEFTIQVTGDASAGTLPGGAIAREDARMLDNDIRYIKTQPINLVQAGQLFYGSTLFWILIVIPFLFFLFFLFFWRNHIRLQANTQLLKTRKAEKLARKRLKLAKKYLDNRQENEFYDEIFGTLWGYLSDKLSIPVSILNKETVSGAFKAKKVPVELSENFLETLNDCEFARFAPGVKEDKMDEIYKKALATIVTIEKDLRGKKDTI
jgi:uncharacterized membrane protein